jgi:hypothetical protein
LEQREESIKKIRLTIEEQKEKKGRRVDELIRASDKILDKVETQE